MAKYLVGTSENAWDFNDAYNAANDGDTLVFEEEYSYSVASGKVCNISKSLNLIGQITSKDKQTTFHNTLYGEYVVKNKAKVSFKNLWFSNSDKSSSIYVTDSSEVTLDNLVIENTNAENDRALVFANKNSQLVMSNVEIKTNNPASFFKVVDLSIIKITDSFLTTKLICDRQSKLELNEVTVEYYLGNALHSTLSDIVLKNSTIKGGNIEKGWPAVWLKQSTLTVKESEIVQSPYDASVYLSDNSVIRSESSSFSSIELNDSRGILEETRIGDILFLNNQSLVSSKGDLQLRGENDKKIDLYIGNGSVLVADSVSVNRVSDPNIRLSSSSFAHLGQLAYPDGDVRKINKEISEDSYFTVTSQAAKSKQSTTGVSLDAKAELDNLIGLNQVKQEITKMLRMVDFNNKRIEQGMSPERQSLHSVFMGNPGTGKTTVARLIGEVLHSKGALTGEELIFVEATESDLISANVGQTAIQTQALLEKAKGGILFIDEAYTLNKKGQSVDFGIEAINTILKFMEDHRDEIMIIFAGYTKEMEEFLKTNPGLASRVPNTFNFEDYTGDEIVQMGLKILSKGNYQLEDKDYYGRTVKREYASSLDNSNGRWIRNFNEKIVKALADRVIDEGSEDITTVKNRDIEAVTSLGKFDATAGKEEALERLDKMIGISTVKRQVDEFVALAEVNKQREEAGLQTGDFSLHSLFLGNPGTGKTTVARIVGEVLYQKGIIGQNKLVEVSRSDLVAGYVGQTAIKTREVLESALGGVLFIDEAYALRAPGTSNDFGQEALDEILKFMEDHRRDIVIIFAGYTKEMSDFLQMNSGLRSRIPNDFNFEDYTPDEIVQIGLLGLKQADYQVDESEYADLVRQNYALTNDRSNGRWVRNLNERLIRIMSTRISKTGSQELNLITSEDLEKVRER